MAINDIENTSGVTSTQEYRSVDDIILNHSMPQTETSSNNQFKAGYRQSENQPLQIKAETNPTNVVSVFDVAQYVLSKLNEPCTTMKLHKLLYYCQAWYLVWEDKPLFKENIEAWANGPVVRALFNFHQGMYWADPEQLTLGNASKLNEVQREDIDHQVHQRVRDADELQDHHRSALRGVRRTGHHGGALPGLGVRDPGEGQLPGDHTSHPVV